MATSVWPVDAKNGAPQYSGRKLRQTTVSVPMGGATAARPLGARSGVRPGTPTSTVTASTTAVTVRPFAGVIDAQAAAESGAYEFSSDANLTFTSSNGFTAADANNARIDIVYVQVNDPAEGDGSATPGITIGYQAGTASASPAVPSTPARAFAGWQLTVPKAGGGNPSVTMVAPFIAAAGGVVPVRSITELNAVTGYAGAYADLTATTDTTNYPVGLYRSDGSTWTAVLKSDDTSWITPTFAGGSTATPGVQYRRRSGIVYLTGLRNPTADDQVQFTLPAGFRPLNQSIFWCDRSANTGPAARMDVRPNGQVYYRQSNVTGGTGAVNYAPIQFPADA